MLVSAIRGAKYRPFQTVKDDDLLLKRTKGSRTTLTNCSPRLKAAVNGALNDSKWPDTSSLVFPQPIHDTFGHLRFKRPGLN